MPVALIPGFRRTPLWLLAAALLAVGQAGLALPLFGSFAGIRDAQPILDGRHPLHLYHGSLGAEAFRDRLAVTCYDPNFQAGYPKTPVFDAGSRPAELFLAFSGEAFDASRYKWGVFVICTMVPLIFVAAARNFGVRPAGSILAGACGAMLWWLPEVQTLLKAGQLDLLLCGLAEIAFLGGLARYSTDAGPTAWLSMVFASVLGWYVQPLAWLGTIPVLALYYLLNAPRHGLAWHLGFFAVLPASLAPNAGWLIDWGRFWWLRQAFCEGNPWPTWRELLGSIERDAIHFAPEAFTIVLIIFGILGTMAMLRQKRGSHALLLLSAAACTAIAARMGAVWLPGRAAALDHATMLLPALATIPAAFAIIELFQHWRIATVWAIFASAIPAGFALFPDRVPVEWRINAEPFQLGFSAEQQRFVQFLNHRTGPAARILIEDGDTVRTGWNWTALLPAYTERSYLGGLDPEGGIEHLTCGMKQGKLLNRPFEEWPSAERAAFCERYNVGWVICRSEAAVEFWVTEPMAREIGRFDDGGEVVVYELERPHSFVRSGGGIVERADSERIVLRDLVPDDQGYVRLSFHFQRELRATPLTVMVEADPDSSDPVPLMRLRLPGPVSRVTLRWQHP